MEAQLVQEQDERLRLESLILEPVPRNQKDRLVGLVVVEPNGLLGASDIPGSSSSWYIFTRQAASRTCRSQGMRAALPWETRQSFNTFNTKFRSRKKFG